LPIGLVTATTQRQSQQHPEQQPDRRRRQTRRWTAGEQQSFATERRPTGSAERRPSGGPGNLFMPFEDQNKTILDLFTRFRFSYALQRDEKMTSMQVSVVSSDSRQGEEKPGETVFNHRTLPALNRCWTKHGHSVLRSAADGISIGESSNRPWRLAESGISETITRPLAFAAALIRNNYLPSYAKEVAWNRFDLSHETLEVVCLFRSAAGI
jgi:hypothetical protein